MRNSGGESLAACIPAMARWVVAKNGRCFGGVDEVRKLSVAAFV